MLTTQAPTSIVPHRAPDDRVSLSIPRDQPVLLLLPSLSPCPPPPPQISYSSVRCPFPPPPLPPPVAVANRSFSPSTPVHGGAYTTLRTAPRLSAVPHRIILHNPDRSRCTIDHLDCLRKIWILNNMPLGNAVRRICTEQIQPRNHVLYTVDDPDYPTRQHELISHDNIPALNYIQIL